MHHRLAQRERSDRGGVEFVRLLAAADNHDLRVRRAEQASGDAVGAGEDPVLLRHAGEDLQRPLRFLAIALVMGVGVQPQQRDGGGGVAGRRGRILEGLAPGRKRADLRRSSGAPPLAGFAKGGDFDFSYIEESAAGLVIEPLDHGIADAAGKVEVAERGRGFIGIETGNRGEGVIIQQAGDVAMLRLRVGVGDDVFKPGLRLPRFCQNAVQRAQREVAGVVELQHARGVQIGGNAQRVPVDIHRFVHIRASGA